MDDNLKEWAEERAIKQTKLPKKTWIKQPDGTSRALVELVRDKDGCVVRIEPSKQLVNQPVAWLYKGDAEFDGKEWRNSLRVTTSKQVADWQGKDVQALYIKE